MDKLVILCVDDQRDVLAALMRDLEIFAEHCRILDCESSAEADELLDEMDSSGTKVALVICDHIMPGQSGVDFLSQLRSDVRFPMLRRILLTGLATHQDTIRAINDANIDRYIEKPWSKSDLLATVKTCLTQFVLRSGLDYQPLLAILDQETLYAELRQRS